LVIHTRKTIIIYTIKYTKYVFGVCLCSFISIFIYLCTKLSDNYVGMGGSKTRYDLLQRHTMNSIHYTNAVLIRRSRNCATRVSVRWL